MSPRPYRHARFFRRLAIGRCRSAVPAGHASLPGNDRHPNLGEISTEEFDRTFKTNVYPLFWLTKAAVPHMPRGRAVVNTTSVNLGTPRPTLLPSAATK